MPEPETPVQESPVPSWGGELAPDQAVLKDFEGVLENLISSCLDGNPKTRLEGFTLTFLEKYHDSLPPEVADSLYSKRQQLVALNAREKTTQQ